MDTINPIVYDFILFCIKRQGGGWPALYDEMCLVAGRRLFRGLGYVELRRLGLRLSLAGMGDTIRMVDAVAACE